MENDDESENLRDRFVGCVYVYQNEIKDNWIEDIDWAKVKQSEKSHNSQASFKEPSDLLPASVDVLATYKKMLQLMQPGETVARAIKRLGGKGAGVGKSAAAVQRRQAWKNKKAQQQMDTGSVASKVSGGTVANSGSTSDKNDLLSLIGCADKLLSLNGEMGIYQDTYEKLSFTVKSMSESAAASRPVDDGLDMFASDSINPPAAAVSVQETAGSTSGLKKGENALINIDSVNSVDCHSLSVIFVSCGYIAFTLHFFLENC